MKRDMGLQRELAIRIEESKGVYDFDLNIDGYDPLDVGYNLKLMIDDGRVDGEIKSAFGRPYIPLIRGLTSSGHDFSYAVRDQST